MTPCHCPTTPTLEITALEYSVKKLRARHTLYSLISLRAFLSEKALLQLISLEEHIQTQGQKRKNKEEEHKQTVPHGSIFIWVKKRI